MNDARKRLSLFTMAIALVVFLIVVLLTNLLINNYIEGRAKKSIESFRDSFRDTFSVDLEYANTDELYLTVDILELPSSKSESEVIKNYLTVNQRNIINKIKEENFEKEVISQIEIDSNNYYVMYFENPYMDSGETDIGTPEIILYTDVTPYKKLIQAMNTIYGGLLIALAFGSYYLGIRMGKVIEDSQQKLKNFFQNASHELKTPIMSIQGYAEGMQLGVIKDSEKVLNIIMDESDKMAHLVDELLYISKLESGQIIIDRQNTNAYDLVTDILSSFNLEIKKNNLNIDLKIKEDFYINVDEKEFSKAVGNIISNAIRFAHSKIEILGRKEDSKYILEIYNDGNLIKDEDLNHLFERFYIGENGNTGIGLSMAMDIIKMHNGNLVAINRENGVSFIITI